jgi:uncharacterized protein (TIRG00374 family)
MASSKTDNGAGIQKSNGFRWLTKALGLVIAAVIYLQLDIETTWSRISNLAQDWLWMSALASILTVVVRGIRWHLMLTSFGYTNKIGRTILVQFSGTALGAVTPGKLGELTKIAYLETNHNDRRSGLLLSTLTERVFDLAALLMCGLIIMLAVVDRNSDTPSLIVELILLVVGLMAIGSIGWKKRKFLLEMLAGLANKLSARQVAIRLTSVGEILHSIGRKDMAVLFLFSMLAWGGYFVTFAFVVRALGVEIDFFNLSFCAVFTALTVTIPISVAGIGTREAALIYTFGIFGLYAADAVSTAIIILALNVFIAAIGLVTLFYFGWQRKF